MDKKDYKKFGGKVSNLISNSFIWLAKDHLLFCENSQFIERYKRFYYKDIQALMVRKTHKSFIVSLVIFVLAAGSLWFLAHTRRGWHIFWEILAGIEFIVLIINVFKGQSCKTYIQTAVQKEELKGIKRVKRYENLLKTIKPYILSFQGEIDPLRLESQYEEALERAEKALAMRPQETEQDSLLHTVLFSFFLGWSLLIGAVYLYSNVILFFLILFVYAIIVILSIMAAVRQAKIKIKPAIKNWSWVSLVITGVFLVMGYIALIASISAKSVRTSHEVDPYAMTLDMLKNIPDNHFVKVIILIAFITSLLIGIVGLVLSAKPRSGINRPV